MISCYLSHTEISLLKKLQFCNGHSETDTLCKSQNNHYRCKNDSATSLTKKHSSHIPGCQNYNMINYIVNFEQTQENFYYETITLKITIVASRKWNSVFDFKIQHVFQMPVASGKHVRPDRNRQRFLPKYLQIYSSFHYIHIYLQCIHIFFFFFF